MKKVYKYGTGHEVPEGAVYLSTEVETVIEMVPSCESQNELHYKKNLFVWHYFLVEVEEK